MRFRNGVMTLPPGGVGGWRERSRRESLYGCVASLARVIGLREGKDTARSASFNKELKLTPGRWGWDVGVCLSGGQAQLNSKRWAD